MKSKLFKKAIACMCTAAMAAQLGIVMPASAAELQNDTDAVLEEATIYYTLNHEDATKAYFEASDDGKATTTKEVWDSQYYWAGLSIATDTDTKIGRYMKYLNNQGKGTRCAFYILPDEAGTLDENQQAVVEFDFKFKNGGTNGNNQITLIGNSATPIQNGDYEPTNKPAGTAAILKMTQPKDGGAQFIINNSGTTLDNATAKSTGYVSDTWAHAKALMNFENHSVILTITSLDGTQTYFEPSQVTMDASAAKLSQIFVAAARDSSYVGIDNVVIRSVEPDDKVGTYYNVTFEVDGKTSIVGAKEGTTLESVPETAKTGYIFDGWSQNGSENLLTDEQVLSTAITADTTFTAVYHFDPDYIEPMVALEFSSFPTNGYPTPGADENTAANNPIAIKIVGEIGGDLTANPDPRVTDLNVDWEFLGFRHIVQKAEAGENPATADGGENKYCDSYAEVVYDDANPLSVDFQLKSVPMNFYGVVKATVTYNGETMVITKPMSILPNKSNEAGVLLPKPGYVTNFDWYADDLVGYQATTSADNKAATDIVTGDWAAYGGNSGRGLYLAKTDEDGKFLKLKSTGTNSSSFAVNKLNSAPTGQVIIEQDIKFYNANSAILFKQDNPVTWKDTSTSISFTFDGTGFNLNGGDKICSATAGKWYKVVLSADVTSKLAFAKVYDKETNELLGSSDVLPFVNAGSISPVYLCYRTPDNSNGECDFNNVKIYTPSIDSNKFTITAEENNLSIPKAGVADISTNITATALSTEGYDMIGKAEWSFDSTVTDTSSLALTVDETNTHTAKLTVKTGAPAGELPINVTIGGVTKQIKINLTSSQDSIQFTKSTASISIPLEENASAEYEYAAKVVGPTSDDDDTPIDIEGKTITYSVYDKNNLNELTTLPEGISFDAATAKLTVTSAAAATTLYIRATSTNRKDEVITKALKVTIHGLAFDFGAGTDEDLVEGYTAVTPSTQYSDATGYGIESGVPTVGGTASTDDADSDNLTGTFTFKAKVQPAKNYNVTINYVGSVASEKVTSGSANLATDLPGVSLSNAEQSSKTYVVPVIDDVLDLTFTSSTVASIVIEKQADKNPNLKPHVFTVGDSTIANNGSWAYVLNRDQGNYTNLTDIVSFSNNGRGGKNLSSFYTGGELRDRVLSQICLGDYVMIGDMGTNGMGVAFEEAFNYYIDACEAMGAKIILNSYSPHGAVGDYASGYNSETHTFDSYRKDAYDEIVRKIYAERTIHPVLPPETDISYNSGKITVKYDKEETAKLIVAEYASNGALNKVTVDDISLTNGSVDVAKVVSENAKIMVWKSLDSAEPLMDSYTVANTVIKYDENVVGFVDIGKMADAAFNAYVADYAANGYADENAAAQAIISCFGDHNHYSSGPLAAQLMIEGYGDGADAKGIVKSLVEIITADLAK